MLFPFLVSAVKIPYPLPSPSSPQPNHSHSWSQNSPILGHKALTRPRASPPIDDQVGHPLLHIQLEPQVLPCDFFDWQYSSKELWGYSLVHVDVPSMGLQNSLAPWVLSLAPSLRTLCSVQWMAVSIYFCICKLLEILSGDSYIRLL